MAAEMTPAYDRHDTLRPIEWRGDRLRLLDQRWLPQRIEHLDCRNAAEVAAAIHSLAVRGAPAIGIAGAYGLVLDAHARAAEGRVDPDALDAAAQTLVAARPTAVNLRWAVERMQARARALGRIDADAFEAEAIAIEREDLAANRRMGELGAALIAPGSGVLTHCNTGSLATAGFGTALGVIRAAWAQGRLLEVFATETRPWLQGARLTVWELKQDGIPAMLIVDSAAAHLMSTGRVQWVVIGADRIAANGDTANKIGSSQLAIAARHHGVRFMVVAPSSTVDLSMPDGRGIEIELRDEAEITRVAGQATAAEGIRAWNPVFDVTPADLIDAIVTERGVVERPAPGALAKLLTS
jgi:methylthioribose-1-phosphate isomerase